MKSYGKMPGTVLVLCLVVITLCHWTNAADPPGILDEDKSSARQISRTNSLFTTEFYKVLREENQGNMIFSPFSVRTVMAMVKAGARGNTSLAIQKGMQFPDDDDVTNRGYRAILASLKSNEDFELEAANRIYPQKGFELEADFTKTLSNFYGSSVEQLDYSKADNAAKTINSWVEQITRKKIQDLISPGDLSQMTRLVLVNAIYFKGQWKNKFNASHTVKAPFHLTASKTVDVDMMKIEAEMRHVDIPELQAKAVAIPYKGDRLSMIVILPDAINGLPAMEEKLKSFNLADVATRLSQSIDKKVILSLPKFKLESTIDLQGPLTKLGMGSIFDKNSANFSGIPKSLEQLYVSKAVQKAFIEVNEEGSEAAAATGIILMTRSGTFKTRKEEFIVDHGFLAFIHDFDNDDILFVTTASNPAETSSFIGGTSANTGDHGAGFRETPCFTLILTVMGFVTFIRSML